VLPLDDETEHPVRRKCRRSAGSLWHGSLDFLSLEGGMNADGAAQPHRSPEAARGVVPELQRRGAAPDARWGSPAARQPPPAGLLNPSPQWRR
jgi:hypothetical protein